MVLLTFQVVQTETDSDAPAAAISRGINRTGDLQVLETELASIEPCNVALLPLSDAANAASTPPPTSMATPVSCSSTREILKPTASLNFGCGGLWKLKDMYEAKLGLDLATPEGLCLLTVSLARQLSATQEALKAVTGVCNSILCELRAPGEAAVQRPNRWKSVSDWRQYISCIHSENWKSDLVSDTSSHKH